jgi:hypothetical protein
MARKSPEKQWNCQNSILFHETIPLNNGMSQLIFSWAHTMCQYRGVSPACGQLQARGLTNAQAAEAVHYHNRLDDNNTPSS